MRWKWIPVAFGLLLIVTVGAAYMVLLRYDYDKLKPRLARIVGEATGRELRLGGEVKLDFGLSPKLVVKNVSLSNAAWGSRPEMIKVEEFRAQARLLPLIIGHVKLVHLGFSGVDLLLETDPTGRGNWNLAVGRRSSEGSGEFKIPKIDVTGIRLENLRLTFRNGKTGAKTHSTLASLDVANLEGLDSLSVHLRAEYNGQPVELSGKIGEIGVLLAGHRFPIELSGKFSNAAFEMTGVIEDVLHLTGVDLKVLASGKDLWGLGLVRGNHLPKTEAFDVAGRLKGSKDALTLEDFVGNLSGGGINLTVSGTVGDLPAAALANLRIEARGKDLAELGPLFDAKLPETEQFTLTGRLTGSAKAPSLHDAKGSASKGSLHVDLKGDIKDLINLDGMDLQVNASGKDLTELGPIFDAKLPETEQFTAQGRLTGSAKAPSLHDAKGSASKGSLRLDLKGGIKDLIALNGMDLELKVSGAELAEVGLLFGTEIPELGPFDVSGRLIGSGNSVSFESLSAVVDQSDFKGHGTLVLHQRPKITLVLESSLVDFTRILDSLEAEKQPTQDAKGGSRLFPTDPLPLDLLKSLDADILVKARNIHAREARFDLGHITLKLDDGRLDVDTIEASYRESKIKGNFHLDPHSEPRLSTDFLVQNLDLGNCFKELGVSDEIQGNADIAVNVKSKGDSVHALMANLDGKVGAVMARGYMPKFLDLLSMDLSRKVIPFWGKHKEAGHIKCAVVEFGIKSGVATSEAFVFNTKVAILGGEGEINLSTEQVNFLLVPKPKKPSLISLATNLRVTGPLMDPKVRPDKISLLTKGAKFLSTLAIGPLGVLVPFANLGANQKHPCDILSMDELKQLNTSKEQPAEAR